ncbi:MAG: hypothetical protein JNK15_07920 [Planctomycetes bacterium]|nr:hypothetical protein [Planctomycetota bacterium]
MNRSLLAVLLCITGPVATTAAQVQVPVNPRATFLGIANDPSALPAPGIPLAAVGLTPGAWVDIATIGGFSIAGATDNSRGLIAVFSSSPQLLTPVNGLVHRVPGAIPIVHGAPTNTANTYNGGYSTNIAEDFVVARIGWSNGAVVQVPTGAAYVFLSVLGNGSSYFSNLSDPNNDFFAVFTPASPAALQGTAEHCELRTGVNGTPTVTPETKQAAAFTTVSVECVQRFGVSSGELFLIGANVYPTSGTPPAGPLPDMHMGFDAVGVQVGTMTTAPGLWSLFVPPGFGGTTVIVQGFLLAPTARNGIVSASNAHRIELQ